MKTLIAGFLFVMLVLVAGFLPGNAASPESLEAESMETAWLATAG